VKICSLVRPGSPEVLCGVVERDHVTIVHGLDVIGFLAAGCSAPSGPTLLLEDVRLLAPVPEPPSIRDFFVFEEHVTTARGKRGMTVPEFWYEEPVFYFTNPAAVIGPDEPLTYPVGTSQLDYELELAAVIGADQAIAGFTVMNDWSARDVQRRETSVGLGPAKAKDFATSLGPFIVTIDEFDGTSGAMTARVNGEVRSTGAVCDMHYSWEQVRDRAACNTRLRPGDVLGSGTVGSGCILESEDERWLVVGDTVTLEIEGIGTLTNRIR